MPSELIRNRPSASEIRPASSAVAQPVADGVWLSAGLSNSYLIVTDAGRIVVNTGMGFESGHHRRLYDAIDQGPVRYILVTQGHLDHVGGVDTFREPGTQLVAQANNPFCQADDARIHRFRIKRSQPYWSAAIAKADAFIKAQPPDSPIPAQSTPTADVLFEDRYEIDLGTVGEEVPDIDTPAAAGKCEVITFDTRPGDVVIHHARTVHAAGSNASATIRRRAISVRYCGDDVRTFVRPGAPRKPHQEAWQNDQLLDPVEHP